MRRYRIAAIGGDGIGPEVIAPALEVMDAARAALKKLELFVVSENVRSNDTVESGAHVLLPAQAWGEKSGTVTNSERRISRQRAFLPAEFALCDAAQPANQFFRDFLVQYHLLVSRRIEFGYGEMK